MGIIMNYRPITKDEIAIAVPTERDMAIAKSFVSTSSGPPSAEQRIEYKRKIDLLGDVILTIPGTYKGNQEDCPLKHSFGDGIYIREIFMPAGKVVVSKTHKTTHPYFVMRGKVSVLTEEGPKYIEAPYQGITMAGTKRALLIHEDTVWITVHATKETEIDKLEDELTEEGYTQPPALEGKSAIIPEIEGGS